MNKDLRQSMLEYYDQRASEYDELYTLGTAPGSEWDPDIFRTEVKTLCGLVGTHCRGKLIDIPAGAGYWLQFYAQNCSSITLVEQSKNMLSECRKKARKCSVEERTEYLRVDILTHHFQHRQAFDFALVGFFLGHLTDTQMCGFFETLRSLLKPSGRFLVLESIYSEPRKKASKEGLRRRTLKDGRVYDIYKRYFERTDFETMEADYGIETSVLHEGQVYIATLASFS